MAHRSCVSQTSYPEVLIQWRWTTIFTPALETVFQLNGLLGQGLSANSTSAESDADCANSLFSDEVESRLLTSTFCDARCPHCATLSHCSPVNSAALPHTWQVMCLLWNVPADVTLLCFPFKTISLSLLHFFTRPLRLDSNQWIEKSRLSVTIKSEHFVFVPWATCQFALSCRYIEIIQCFFVSSRLHYWNSLPTAFWFFFFSPLIRVFNNYVSQCHMHTHRAD